MMRRLALLFLLLYPAVAGGQLAVRSGIDSIRQDEIRAKLSYLASDHFHGRGNGTQAIEMAARYIADVFRASGLEPVGSQSGYYQSVRVERLGLGRRNRLEITEDGSTWTLQPGDEFIPHHASIDREVTAPLVFVGFGITARHLGYDDLVGVDLEGKIAVVLDRRPRADDLESPFNAFSMADLGSVTVKVRNVQAAGGVGLIVIEDPKAPDGDLRSLASRLRYSGTARSAPMVLARDPDAPSIPIVLVSANAGRRLVPRVEAIQRMINRTLRSRHRDLGKLATLSTDLERRPFVARNVIGRIEGSDPHLENEVHHHRGTLRPRRGEWRADLERCR